MKLKSSLLKHATELALFIFLACCAGAFGQAATTLKPAAPLRYDAGKFSSDRKKGHAAYLRVVSALPPGSGLFKLNIAPNSGEKSDLPLQGPYASLYRAVSAGPCTLRITTSTDPEQVFAEVRATLEVNAYATLWIAAKDGVMSAVMMDDNYDRTNSSNRLVVWNYFPGSVVDITPLPAGYLTQPSADDARQPLARKVINEGEAYGFDKIGEKEITVRIEARLASGKKSQYVRTVQFGNNHRFSLLLAPDSYGDFETTMMADGPALNAETTVEAELVTGDDAGKDAKKPASPR